MPHESTRQSRRAVVATVTPKTHYQCLPMLEGDAANLHSWSHPLPSVPILDLERRDSATYTITDSVFSVPESRSISQRPPPPSPIQRLLRSWIVLRYTLARTWFAQPVPLLTRRANLKLGDLLITLPLVAGTIGYTACYAAARQVAASGTLASMALAAAFGLVVRTHSVVLLCTGLSFERALVYHNVAASVTLLVASLHGVAYVLDPRRAHLCLDATSSVLTGLGTLSALVLIHALSLRCIRRTCFNFFVRVHWLLFLVVLGGAILHGALHVVLGAAPWAIDLVYRRVYRSRVYAHGSLCGAHKGVIAHDQLSLCALPGNITRIQFPRVRPDTHEAFAYDAGQYAFLCIPSIARFEWHPFTIASAPHEAMVTFYIKATGTWTTKLLAVALKREACAMRLDGPSTLTLRVDGPYGKLAIDLASPTLYGHIVLFSSGICMTPMRSIVNWLHHECYYRTRGSIPHVRFIWTVKDMETIKSLLVRDEPRRDSCLEVDAVASYLPHILSHPRNTNQTSDAFVSEVYLTRDIVDGDAQYLQELANCLHIGVRPDAIAILREMGEEAKSSGKDRVAVLVCGPMALVDDVLYASIKLARELNVHFDVHQETFRL